MPKLLNRVSPRWVHAERSALAWWLHTIGYSYREIRAVLRCARLDTARALVARGRRGY